MITTSQSPRETPFLPIGQGVRVAFLFYLIAYRVVFPLLHAVLSDGSKDLLALRFIAEFFYTCLLAYPFIFYRKEYGWLHPLVLPTVYMLAKMVAKNPLSLVFPFDVPLVDFAVETSSIAATLSMSNIDLAWTRLNLSLVYCFAQSVYLACFLFVPTFKVPQVKFAPPRHIALAAGAFIAMLVGIASIFIVAQGGVSALLVAMRGGRHALFEDSGHLVFAGVAAPLIAMAWFAYEKRPWSNPLFLVGLVSALLISVIVSGSRSSVIMPVLGLVLLWWWRRGRPILIPTGLTVVFALIVLGGFGSIRQEYGSRTLDLSVFSPARLEGTIAYGLEDIKVRANAETSLAVMAGANQKGLLWGRSYLNAAVFWIPRAIWSDKPRAIDTYNMWINFQGNPIDVPIRDWGTWGIPVSAEMEAYWNFGFLGVALIFGLVGVFHGTLARAAHMYRTVPIFWVAYIYIVLNVDGSSKSIVDMVRYMAVLIVFALVAGIVRFGRGAERFPGPVGDAAGA